MNFSKVLLVYLCYLTMCSASKSQSIEITGNKLFEESNLFPVIVREHAQRKGRDNPSENKQTIEIKSPCNDPRVHVQTQVTSLKQKSMPISFINNKPQTIPTKIPLIIKTVTAKPAPAHYQRLKANLSKQNKVKPKEININFNKPKPKVKIIPKDRIQPNSILSIAPKSKKSRNQKRIPEKKLSSINFYEDDTNVEFLPPALKPPVTRNIKKIEKNNLSKEFPPTVHSDVKQKAYKFETENDDNDEVRIKNRTHLIHITKLPSHEICKHESEHEHSEKSHDSNIFNVTSLPIALGELVKTLKAKKDKVEEAPLYKDGVESFTELTSCKIEPVVTQIPDNDESDVITITNHNYEELEERSGTYPESNLNETNTEWAVSPLQDAVNNPYNYYHDNSQGAYDQYLKYAAKNNPVMYNKDNFYPGLDVPEAISLNELEFPQTYSPPRETQMVQDIYLGQKPDFNIVDIRPENPLGRIWRTWKDTEIKISKPNILLNKAIVLGRCLNNMHETNFGEIKPQTLYRAPAIGRNGYYDSLNNQLSYPYSYSGYRYIL